MYNLEITFKVSLADWRIDDPTDIKNSEWCLWVFDRNLQEWIPTTDCTRPGEKVSISRINLIKDEASGRIPEDPT